MARPRTAVPAWYLRAGLSSVDLCVGERHQGPIFLNRDRTRRLDRHASDIVATFVAGASR